MGVGTNLKRLRTNKTKFSQQDMADQLNIDSSTGSVDETENTAR